LIEQAERVQELEEESRFQMSETHKNLDKVIYLDKENKRYREVIKKAIDDLENECLWDALVSLKALEGEE
ncbi:MAG TPA: hypothetical protein VK048_02665, partial [Atopostipes sp.]|nr:hypothetical protein [Atopostipes sp.]